jgi:phage gp36-like protein
MLVSVEDLSKTSLYPEIIERIVRGNTSNAELQILAAESLTKSYMSKYDIQAIFGDKNNPPTFIDEHIKKIVKVIASYYLVRLANPNVNIELYRADYEDAIVWLERLQDGKVNPDLPYAPDNPDNPGGDNNDVWWSSNPKRINFF